jgi:acyl transferase domain-containing protein/thioesterase domain-containing protein/aryl carrier-like protein
MKSPETFDRLSGSEIAIIGMAGRFPGAPDIEAFWNNLRDGVESITVFTDEQLLASGVDPEALQSTRYVKAGCILEGVELFDAAFFGFNPRAAAAMDPQHRLLLECVWEAIEAAGYDAERYKGAISVFAGSSMSSYLMNNLYANPEAFALAGRHPTFLSNAQDSLATLIAYKLNLKGACYTVGTFCSTSLVAVHLACQSLLNFECDMAVAGGVRVAVPQHTGYWYEEGLFVSPDGHCRPFDTKAQGTVFGNGLGAVVLKRLKDALADGDPIDAVILGSATNNDGSLKVSYTAPSVAGQSEVIVEALANAGVQPETITYVETHGTGTPLGDLTEVAALTRAFRSGTQKKGICALGSVKSNIGHVDAAAGVAGLIKTVLALKYKQIPPSLNFHEPNTNIDFASSPFYVNSTLSEWKSDGFPRRAGVSAFGIGGTNAHVILEEAPVPDASGPSRPSQLLVLSAKSRAALEMATRSLIKFLKSHPDLNLPDAAYTLQVGRRAFNHRRVIICRDVEDAVSAVEAAEARALATAYQDKRNPPVTFMFSGQGAQYVRMGSELYKTESKFREQIDRCSKILQSHLSIDIRLTLYPDEVGVEEAARRLNQTSITQPALFIVEYALARQWMAWGMHPANMIGHSIGEYVAACLAGVFSLEDALALVAARGRLMQSLPGGSMLAVRLPEKSVRSFMDNELSLAAINSPSLCTVSGAGKAVEDFKGRLSERNVDCRPLHTSHAFHSGMMDPVIDAFADEVKRVRRNPPQIPFISNVTGTWITPEEAMAPDYWAKHLRRTVQFSGGVQELLKEPNRVFLEVGPGNTLSTLVKQHLNGSEQRAVLSSIRHPHEQELDVAYMLNTLGRLWLAGVEVDWFGFHGRERRHRVHLPTYPFERRRYWVEPTELPRGYFAARAGLTGKQEILPRPAKPEILKEELAPRDPGLQSEYVAPQTKLEEMLSTIWRKFLGIDKIGIHDNYFDLGGDSILAVHLFAEIEKEYKVKVPLATLFEAPTIAQLAQILRHEAPTSGWSPLVTIQPTGSRPPFFCIHGAGGGVLLYRDLSRYLGSDQPFYGLQAQGQDGSCLPLTRIEDMAALYLKEIRKVRPHGPYFLGGYCMGGTVAYEVAQRLQAEGEQVGLLAMFDTYNWCKITRRSIWERAYHAVQRLVFHAANCLSLNSEGKSTFFWEKAKHLRSRIPVWRGMLLAIFDGHSQIVRSESQVLGQIWEANDRAVLNYVPKPYPGTITDFRPQKQYRMLNQPGVKWDHLAEGGQEIVVLPVYPGGMLVEPFVKDLADALRRSIDSAIHRRPS